MIYSFTAKFHANVQALHKGTLEVTCEERLTPRGDCVVLTSSDHDPLELTRSCPEGRKAAFVVVTRFGGFWVEGTCAPFQVDCEFVIRKSRNKVPKTLIVGADKGAWDLPRDVIRKASLWGARAVALLVVR